MCAPHGPQWLYALQVQDTTARDRTCPRKSSSPGQIGGLDNMLAPCSLPEGHSLDTQML